MLKSKSYKESKELQIRQGSIEGVRVRNSFPSIMALCLVVCGILLIGSCSTSRLSRKEKALRDMSSQAKLVLPREHDLSSVGAAGLEQSKADYSQARRDTLVSLDSNEPIIMKAIRSEDGEMVATDVIQAAYVEARFRNVAERQGKVELCFNVVVPKVMMDGNWQVRLYPDMYILEDSLRLDPIYVTGREYRGRQLRGYERYNKWLDKIVSDSTTFINQKMLELFLWRNIPQVFAFKTDTTVVSAEQFASVFGVTEQQAIDHYTNKFRKKINDRRKRKQSAMFTKFVKAPIISQNIRLDTVIMNVSGDLIYQYSQEINVRPELRRADIILGGEIYEQDRPVYVIPRSSALTFYISSLSAFVEDKERYLTKVISRRAEANTSASVEFALGKSDINLSLGNNEREIENIKNNFRDIMGNAVYDLDSVTVSASTSPEGEKRFNERLSLARSRSVADYFDKFMRGYIRELEAKNGYAIDENGRITREKYSTIPMRTRSGGEGWNILTELVQTDTAFTEDYRKVYMEYMGIKDLDSRELKMRGEPWYTYMKDNLYPKLRATKFDFYLHRKGMVKDTVHTTVLDTVYASGVQAIRDMDYKKACAILRPYEDFNAAVAFCADGRDASAMSILSKLPKSARRDYMLALLYARKGDDVKAVELYTSSCEQDHSFVYRGNLDPEISVLIRRYNLNAEPDDDIPVDL